MSDGNFRTHIVLSSVIGKVLVHHQRKIHSIRKLLNTIFLNRIAAVVCLVERYSFHDTEVRVKSSMRSTCCVLKQDIISALPQSTKLSNVDQVGSPS